MAIGVLAASILLVVVLVSAIAAVERACVKCGYAIEFGKAVGTLQKGLVKE